MTELAYVDHSMKVSLTDDTGKTPVSLNGPGETQMWPVWSPNGRYVVYSAFSSGSNGHGHIGIYVHDLSTAGTTEIFTNEPGSDGIARRTPHYVLWSPDNRLIALVVRSRADGLSLFVHRIGDDNPPTAIHTGFPLFSSWSRDSRFLLLHSGAEHYLVDFESGPNAQKMTVESRLYMAPSWSSQADRMGILREGHDYHQSLMIGDVDGQKAELIAEFDGSGAFAWSPDGESFALTREPQGESRFYKGLRRLLLDGTEQQLIGDLVLAFFWSPTGKEIAYITTSDAAEGSVRWGLVNVETGSVRYLSDFRPTEEQLNTFMFFDQYVQSHNPWSPDGTTLIYSGVLGYTKDREPLPQQNEAQIIVENVSSGTPMEIARGVFGAWSPRT